MMYNSVLIPVAARSKELMT